MILISYDIANDKLRRKFAKDLEKYGYRIQYSVWKIDNSERILNNIKNVIENTYKKKFGEEDSVYILRIAGSSEAIRYGYAKHEDKEVIRIDRNE
ncbi:MAG: CRISPR-associated endonuclease Cas2 [Erysipelotrichaceae bacterium]|nr:CRISPR-associated endonuclease Cas2 [Erysipelotrichaceae bacterium]